MRKKELPAEEVKRSYSFYIKPKLYNQVKEFVAKLRKKDKFEVRKKPVCNICGSKLRLPHLEEVVSVAYDKTKGKLMVCPKYRLVEAIRK